MPPPSGCSVPPPSRRSSRGRLRRDDRTHLLELVARAERRIPLAGPQGLADWLGRRAAVLILPGTLAAPADPRRQVRLDPAVGGAAVGIRVLTGLGLMRQPSGPCQAFSGSMPRQHSTDLG